MASLNVRVIHSDLPRAVILFPDGLVWATLCAEVDLVEVSDAGRNISHRVAREGAQDIGLQRQKKDPNKTRKQKQRFQRLRQSYPEEVADSVRGQGEGRGRQHGRRVPEDHVYFQQA